jgi:hypothetical protein
MFAPDPRLSVARTPASARPQGRLSMDGSDQRLLPGPSALRRLGHTNSPTTMPLTSCNIARSISGPRVRPERDASRLLRSAIFFQHMLGESGSV